MAIVNENSATTITSTFPDTSGNNQTPDSVSYTIHDIQSGTEIRASTALTPASSVDIDIEPHENRILDRAHAMEGRKVTVTAVDGVGQVVNEHVYKVRRLKLGDYDSRLEALSPIRYWSGSDESGAALEETIAGSDAAHSNLTLAGASFPNDDSAPVYDGQAAGGSTVNLGVEELASFDQNERAWIVWFKATSAAWWDNGTAHYIGDFSSGRSGLSDIAIYKNTAGELAISANGASQGEYTTDTVKDAKWHAVAVSYSVADDEVVYYLDGAPVATGTATDWTGTSGYPGFNSGQLGSNFAEALSWSGALAKLALFDRPLTAAEAMSLAVPV